MDPVITAHVMVFNEEGKVLLVRHEARAGQVTGVYGLPGGRMQKEEQLVDTAIRELEEETGLVVCKKDLHTYPHNNYSAQIKKKDGSKKDYTMYVFITKNYKGDLQPSNETTPEWMDVKNIYRKPLLPNIATAVMAGYDFVKHL